MSGFASLFSQMNFKGTIQKYASASGWRIAEINDRRAVISFKASSGRTQTLFIIRFESTLEFSVPSGLVFDSESEIPHLLSTALLKRSAQRKIGFWCIEQIGGKEVYSCMHNAEMELLDSNYFAKVVMALVSECDEFESSIMHMLRS